MVYNLGSTLNLVGAGLSNKYFIAIMGNPLFPLIAISLVFLLILGVIFYWSDSKDKLKRFSIFGLITILAVAVIIFSNKYFQGKKSSGFTGGNSVKLPDASYFMNIGGNTVNDILPDASFGDLFD